MNSQTVIIRDRYQITLPSSLRNIIDWLSPRKAVRVSLLDKEKVLIEPYTSKPLNWEEIFKSLKIIKNSGQKTSLSQFIVRDRNTH